MACADWAPRTGARPWALLAAVSLLAGACASAPPLAEPPAPPDPPEAGELRARYRSALCDRLAPGARACDEILLREAGEAAPVPGPSRAAAMPSRYRVAFVPGLLAECLETLVRPFGDVMPALAAQGYEVVYLSVPGRGNTVRNAEAIAAGLEALAPDARPLLVFAYSKGLPDTLEFLVRHPRAARQVAAVVGVAGAAMGSPFADELHALYRDWVAALPMPGCAAGSGAEILDLRRDVRREWWAAHGAQVRVPVFSLVTTPRPERVSFGSRIAFRQLSRLDLRNDSKILWSDQIVPGSRVLGFVNADHWSIAVPLSQALPALSALFRDDVPRAALVEAAIEVVDEALAARAR